MPELSEIINSFVIFQLKRSYQKHFSAAGLFKYVWHFSRYQTSKR